MLNLVGDMFLQMDVQAVKLYPDTNASAIFYKQRLQVHNFTIYNLGTKQCSNYWFNETQGDLCASTFVSCIVHHLNKYCLNDTLPIIIYSDGCGYQNRNVYLSNALSAFAINNNKIVEQKYLEKGHTHMECDSVHAKIEKKAAGRNIFVPFDYSTITREARKTVNVNGVRKDLPLDVEYLSYTFFKNYKDVSMLRYKSIRPGRQANDPTVSHLRSLIYLPNGSIKYKINFDDSYNDLPIRAKPYVFVEPKQLWDNLLPIKKAKWDHLQQLKPVIPIDHHTFYDEIKFIK